jgi:hypothetical protein
VEITRDEIHVLGEGRDRLRDVEAIEFGSGEAFYAPDGEIDLSLIDGITTLTAEEIVLFVEMYVAYFGRAPNATGLFFWGAELARGRELEDIAEAFARSPEAQARFPDRGDFAALVDAAYANLLERAPDAAGRAWWIEELKSGGTSKGGFVLAMIEGAKANPDGAEDVRTVADKGDLGLYFSAIRGITEGAGAREVMAAYDRGDPSGSLDRARDLIDGFASEAEFTMALVGIVDDPFALA